MGYYDKVLDEILEKYDYKYSGVIDSTKIHATLVDIFTEKCTGKKTAIWGVGKKNKVNSHAAVIIKKYILNLNGLSCLIDSSPDIQGTKFMGYPVISPEDLKQSGIEVIIIGSRASAKAIAQNIKQVYPECEYINIYEELENRGIKIDYNFFSEHNTYSELYDLRIKYFDAENKNKANALKKLISAYLSIRDFYYAEKYANIYIDNRYENYEKTFEIEIINELSASVYNRVLNYVLNHELNKNDSQLLEVNLLNQLKLAKRVNLFDYSLEELQAVHEYWRSMNRYSKQVLNKEKVA